MIGWCCKNRFKFFFLIIPRDDDTPSFCYFKFFFLIKKNPPPAQVKNIHVGVFEEYVGRKTVRRRGKKGKGGKCDKKQGIHLIK